MTMLAVNGLSAGYGKIEVLHDVSLSIDRGQIVALIGANGAGKTTLLKTISGLIRPTAGRIEFAGKSIVHRPPHKIVALGLSQVPEGRAILKRMTVLDNLRMGAFTRRDAQIGRDIDAVLERFPALGARRHKLAATLSGGEQQMLAVGRALVACHAQEQRNAAQNVYRSVEHDQKTGLTTFGQCHQHHSQMPRD